MIYNEGDFWERVLDDGYLMFQAAAGTVITIEHYYGSWN